MKLLVFGKTGQVARELQRAVSEGGPDNAAESWNAHFLGRNDADLSDPDACAAAIREAAPDVVINAAAYTGVDKAEEDEPLAHIINAAAPGAMAVAARETGAAFLHISTDYVFDGCGNAPFTPADPTGPLGAYGRTKLTGEKAIAEAGGNWLVLRTSWVVSSHGNNFVRTMLRLGAERESLNVVDDQIGGPTPARAIAAALLGCARAMHGREQESHKGGIYHFCGTPAVSWAEFASAIMAEAGLDCRIDAIPTSGYPTPAQRPGNSRLDCSDLKRDFGIAQPNWRAFLPQIITELQS